MAADQRCQEIRQGHLQKIHGHDCHACLGAQHTAGVAAAQVAAAMLPHIGAVKDLADYIGKGHGADQIANKADEQEFHMTPHLQMA